MLHHQLSPQIGCISLILLTTIPYPAGAATFTVTNLNDSGAGSLRQAILNAKNAAGNDVIVFQAGLSGTIFLTGGELLIDSNLTINGPGAGALAVDGNGSSNPLLNRVFKIAPGVTVTLDGLTIKNGFIPNCWTNPNPPPPSICTDDGGAGIENSGALTLRNSVVSGNYTAKIGGGISNKESGVLTIISSSVSGNETSRYGGGIFNVGAMTLANSAVSNNKANVFSGGGIYNTGALTIRDSTISGNSASQEDGGGIYNTNPGQVVVINSTISGNSAKRYGGGVANCDIWASNSNEKTILKVFNSTISGNSASHGGGVTNCGHTAIGNSTITNNSASATSSDVLISGGGGIFSRHAIQWYGETLTIGNSWVAGNRSGDGITGKSNEILIWMGAQEIQNIPFFSLGHSIFGDNGNVGVWADGAYYDGLPYFHPSDLMWTAPTSTALGPLADNGGPTKTHLPTMNGGPLDLGDNNLIPTDPLTGQPFATDQRGQPRIQNGKVDIGAVEGATRSLATLLAGLSRGNQIYYTLDLATWANIPGQLAQLQVGDFNNDGQDDLVGLASNGSIWYTTNRSAWIQVPGSLAQLQVGDFNNDGQDDLVGLAGNGSIWYTTNLTSWTPVPGSLADLRVGDLNGDGKADLAGLASNNSIWYTTNLTGWTRVSGNLAQLRVGDLNGDGKADLAGLASNGSIWYTINLTGWVSVPGSLADLRVGDLNGDGKADLAGLASNNSIWYTTNLTGWTPVPGSLAQLLIMDLNGDGKGDLVGLAGNDTIWYTTNLTAWVNIPGQLAQLAGR